MLCGGIMMTAMAKYGTAALDHIAKAGSLAEEVIGSIRTVQAFGKEKILGDKFADHIEQSKIVGRKGSIFEGFGLSIMCKCRSPLHPYIFAYDNYSLRHLRRLCPRLLLRWHSRQ